MTRTVLIENTEAGARIVRLNRPERLNAITPQLVEDLVEALQAANADPQVRAIVLCGSGRGFCSGDDLKDFDQQLGSQEQVAAYVNRIQDVTRAILCGGKVVIGAIHGWAVGGGLEWVINCDFVVAGESSRFFFPELSWGLFVTGGVTRLLPMLIGLQKTRELIMLGEEFTAAQALDWRLIWKVVPDDQVLDRALTLAHRIASLPQGRVRDLKRILTDSTERTLEDVLATETAATTRGFLDPETARRILAFGRDKHADRS